MRDQSTQFSLVTVLLHWAVAIFIIGLLAVGTYMEGLDNSPQKFELYHWHKSFGVLILVLVLPRVIWRVINGWPTPVGHYSAMENKLAKIVHWVLILATIFMPLSGMMMSGAGGYGIPFFSTEIASMNVVNGEIIAHNATAAKIGGTVHEFLSKLLILALALHIIGSLKHHFIDKDGTIRRMLGRRI